ncbi:hypothetical protein BOX30_04525 [Leptospirillum ferriphilum]|nr:hypothetical protein BOX30_04525 [Leptospirillum ferriphilum]
MKRRPVKSIVPDFSCLKFFFGPDSELAVSLPFSKCLSIFTVPFAKTDGIFAVLASKLAHIQGKDRR